MHEILYLPVRTDCQAWFLTCLFTHDKNTSLTIDCATPVEDYLGILLLLRSLTVIFQQKRQFCKFWNQLISIFVYRFGETTTRMSILLTFKNRHFGIKIKFPTCKAKNLKIHIKVHKIPACLPSPILPVKTLLSLRHHHKWTESKMAT